MDITTQRAPFVGLPWRQIGVLALIALLLAATIAVVVGTQRRSDPAPLFGRAENGNIAYAVEGDIYAGDPATGESAVVLAGETFDSEPTYSRDGTMIAFERRSDPTADNPEHLMVMDADGSNVRQVTVEPLVKTHWWEWAPDGSALVVVDEPRGARVFQMLDVDGVEPPRTLAEGLQVDVPSFRPPDSGQILFRGQKGLDIGLFVMDADGTGITPLIEPARSNNPDFTLREPRYSPDGTQIAYHQWDDIGIMRLYVMDADGTDRRELGAAADIWFTGWPVWSNDGTRIAVQRGIRDADHPSGFGLPTAIIDVRDGSVIETGPALPDDGARMEWAPDDSVLLIRTNQDQGGRQVLLDPAGGPWREAPWAADSYPSWQRVAP